MKPSSQKVPRESAFQKAARILAYTLATAMAFFATGPAYTASAPSIREFVASAYAPELMGVASLGWFIIVALSVFALATIVVFLLVQISGTWAGQLAKLFKFK